MTCDNIQYVFFKQIYRHGLVIMCIYNRSYFKGIYTGWKLRGVRSNNKRLPGVIQCDRKKIESRNHPFLLCKLFGFYLTKFHILVLLCMPNEVLHSLGEQWGKRLRTTGEQKWEREMTLLMRPSGCSQHPPLTLAQTLFFHSSSLFYMPCLFCVPILYLSSPSLTI